jgi:beta-glucosidase
MEAEPLYRFGYGLSYTTFVYDHLDLGESVIGPEDEIQVSVEISNTGEHDADEVVQLYVENVGRSVPAPRVHLQGFQRVYIPAGGTAGADFILRASQLAVFDEEGKPFVEPGTYRISVGGAQPSDPIFTGQSAELTVRT